MCRIGCFVLFFASFFVAVHAIDFRDFIKTHDAQNMYVHKISFESDIPFQKSEFLYVTGLRSNATIALSDITRAIKNLKLKQRIKQVAVDVTNTEDGYNLHFTLTSHWIFKKLMIQGIWFDKHKYASLYRQHPGDIFDIVLHEQSAENIKEYLYDNGYFNGDVHDELVYKKFDKSIISIIHIKRRQVFYIDKIDFTFDEYKRYGGFTTERVKRELARKIGINVLDRNYSKDLVKKQIEKIKKFFKRRGFLECRVSCRCKLNKSKHNLELVFTIKLGPKRFLRFEGNKLFSGKQIKEDILGFDYPSWVFSCNIIAEQLMYEYYKKGYWNVVIKPQKEDEDSFLFSINENFSTEVDNVLVKEQKTYDQLDRSNFFDDFLKHKRFDEDLLNEAVERLRRFYLEQGFWNFSVLDKQFIKKDGGKKCSVVVIVKKGEQRFFGGAKIDEFQDAQVNDFFAKYNRGAFDTPFNYFWLSEQKAFLLKLFYGRGYWYADFQPELLTSQIITPDDKKTGSLVFVKWKANLGKKVTFGKIFLHGDTSVPFRKILKEVRFKKGDVWDKTKIDLTRKRLKKYDVFKTIQMQPLKMSEPEQDEDSINQPILLRLIDDDPLQARFRLGYFLTSKNFVFKRASTYRVGSSLIIKNPTNRADKLLLNADFSRFERRINFDYKIPDPFGLYFKRFSLIGKFKAYTNKYTHSVEIRKSGSAFEAIQNGFLFGLSNEYKDGYFCGVNVGNEWLKTSRVRGNLKLDEDFVGKTLPFLFIEPSIIIDRLDDRFYTKKGTLSFFSLKCNIPERMGNTTAKFTTEQTAFFPLFKHLTLGLRARFGYIFRSTFDQVQPIDRFYLGGPYSVRGYEKDAVPPLGVSEVVNDAGQIEKRYTIQGGSSMFNGNIEVRFPIYKALKGVVFQDVGVLSQTGVGGFRGRWFPATGFGLRYKTPLGMIRFDIGWKWKKILEGDNRYAWYLTLGEAF